MLLGQWVQRYGTVVGPEFLRVDGFLNHRIDPTFMEEVGRQISKEFGNREVSCVLTAEAAGNVVAYEVARRLGAKALYAKKGHAATMNHPYVRSIVSPTKGTTVELSISKNYLDKQERVLIVDDFLYRGDTSAALADMVLESGASLLGFGFVIAKEFGKGRQKLAHYEKPVVTLVSIVDMDPETGRITFSDRM